MRLCGFYCFFLRPCSTDTAVMVFPSPNKTLVKTLAKNLVKNLAKHLVKNLAKNLVKNLTKKFKDIEKVVVNKGRAHTNATPCLC